MAAADRPNFKIPVDAIEARMSSHARMLKERGYTVQMISGCLKRYDDSYDELEAALDRVAKTISGKQDPGGPLEGVVHSVRRRLKSPVHLVDKLIRKATDKDRPRLVKPGDLFHTKHGINDLAGIRIIQLYKPDWVSIHDFLTQPHAIRGFSCDEKLAYLRRNDRIREYIGRFRRSEIKRRDSDYSSLHYRLRRLSDGRKTRLCVECQVRTLFEEGWGEIDHQHRYPFGTNPLIESQLGALNNATSAANSIALSLLATLRSLPTLLSWGEELHLERSAAEVFCLSRDLGWLRRNSRRFIESLSASETVYHYFYVEKSRTTEAFVRRMRSRLRGSRGQRVTFAWGGAALGEGVPVLSDLLLLRRCLDRRLVRGTPAVEVRDVAIIGTPYMERIAAAGQLDMIVRDESAVGALRQLFERLGRDNQVSEANS